MCHRFETIDFAKSQVLTPDRSPASPPQHEVNDKYLGMIIQEHLRYDHPRTLWREASKTWPPGVFRNDH